MLFHLATLDLIYVLFVLFLSVYFMSLDPTRFSFRIAKLFYDPNTNQTLFLLLL